MPMFRYDNSGCAAVSDYYLFGMPMPSRTSPGNGYRYGFNGQEKENEIYGEGNTYSAEYWMYDSRLGRRWNLDPVDQISISNYAVLSNSPIINIDPNGDVIVIANSQTGQPIVWSPNMKPNTGDPFADAQINVLNEMYNDGGIGYFVVNTLHTHESTIPIIKAKGSQKSHYHYKKHTVYLQKEHQNKNAVIHELAHVLDRYYNFTYFLLGDDAFSRWGVSERGDEDIAHSEKFAVHIQNIYKTQRGIDQYRNFYDNYILNYPNNVSNYFYEKSYGSYYQAFDYSDFNFQELMKSFNDIITNQKSPSSKNDGNSKPSSDMRGGIPNPVFR